MPTYRELLQADQGRDRRGRRRARRRRSTARVWIDVREADEWEEGHIPGAVHVPRGNLESRIEGVVPDQTHAGRPLLRRPAARSAFAAKTLAELGYETSISLAGGFTDWKRNGYEIVAAADALARRSARATRATC